MGIIEKTHRLAPGNIITIQIAIGILTLEPKLSES